MLVSVIPKNLVNKWHGNLWSTDMTDSVSTLMLQRIQLTNKLFTFPVTDFHGFISPCCLSDVQSLPLIFTCDIWYHLNLVHLLSTQADRYPQCMKHNVCCNNNGWWEFCCKVCKLSVTTTACIDHPVGIFQWIERLVKTGRWRTNATDHQCFGIAAQRVLSTQDYNMY